MDVSEAWRVTHKDGCSLMESDTERRRYEYFSTTERNEETVAEF